MRFNPLDHPLALLMPSYLGDSPSWIGHIPFAFALVEMAEPRNIVELGTFKGDSYMAFCQAVAVLQLPTQCFAIDTWKGDAQTGFYDDRILAALRGIHDPMYSRFSTLIQKDFDAAAGDFADGSIDLLHIDGMHTYAEVKHDFETWLPKMSDAGVILLHDTAMREPTFEVWRLWEEVAPRYPHFNFEHAAGLGVLGVGKQLAEPVKVFLDSVTGSDSFKREEAGMVRAYFSHLGSYIQRLQLLYTVVGAMHQQQLLVNAWKDRQHLPVLPGSNDLQSALVDCKGYSANLTRDIQSLVQQGAG
jgi:hypothetical protein